MMTFEQRLLVERRGISVARIEEAIARARAVIHAPEIDRIQDLLDEARAMFDAGRLDYAMGLGQAAWEGANALHFAIQSERTMLAGFGTLDPLDDANAKAANNSAQRKADWQRRADAYWSDAQHKGKSARCIASFVFKEFDEDETKAGGKLDTIRKAIKEKLA
jgi:hypothetical protein